MLLLTAMVIHIRRWAVIVLLAVLPATLFAQGCDLGCNLARMSAPMGESSHQSMPDRDHLMSVASDADDGCPMAALCDFAHLTALPIVLSFDSVAVVPTVGVAHSHASFTSTSFPPAQRPPAA